MSEDAASSSSAWPEPPAGGDLPARRVELHIPGVTFVSAGSLIIILVWVYDSAQILFFGAAFTRVYAFKHGSHRSFLHAHANDRARQKANHAFC